jgi:dTDP-4-amino-4,6-dideoxygalactose transaminase
MAFAALGIGPGCTVVVPANTFLATANAAVYLGAQVRFCDVDPLSGLMTPETLQAVIDKDVSLVVPVHFAGQPCDMPAIAELVRKAAPEASIVEDASHAIGASHQDGSPVGALTWSSMATFSFHPVKHLAAGEGGAVTVDNPEHYERLAKFRCHGMTKDPKQLDRVEEGPWYYEMHDVGFNYRIPEMSCALACSQLKKLSSFVHRRREIAQRYFAAWADIPEVQLPPRQQLTSSSWHLFCLHIDFESLGLSRKELMAILASRGIGSQVHYYPVCFQPYYAKQSSGFQTQFSGARRHYESELSIPMYPGMSDADVDKVIGVVADVFHDSTSSRLAVA